MAIQSMQLDPNAASYTDDEIVGKVNTAAVNITREDAVNADAVFDGTTNKVFTGTEQTKLSGVEESAAADQTGAEIKTAYETEANAYTNTKDTKLTGIEDSATADQTGNEIVTAIDAGSSAITREGALSQDDLKLVKTNPVTGEFQVKNIHRDADGKLDVEFEDTPES